MTFHRIFFAATALFLAFATTALYASATHAQGRPGGNSAIPVIVSIIQEKAFYDEVEALGTLKANESVDISSTVTERVTAILFNDNQRVEKGDMLIEMDTAQERSELAEQQSILNEAKRQVGRLSPLARKGAASKSSLDASQSAASAAQARLEGIQARIDQRQIKAPFSGVLGLRDISVGALAQTGQMLVTLDDTSRMKIDFSVPEVFLSTLKQGMDVIATTRAYPKIQFYGTVSSVNSRVDPITRAVTGRAIIDNKDGLLLPGMLMHVLLKKNPRSALLAPEEAIISDADQSYVFVVEQQDQKTTARKQKVELGARSFGYAEILSGLAQGDEVVTHGTLRVRPGAALQITATEKDDEPLGKLLKQKQEKALEPNTTNKPQIP